VQNGWIGHNGNTMSYMVCLNSGADIPVTWRMMQDITGIISPGKLWTCLPKE
jgi:hypothetical protein